MATMIGVVGVVLHGAIWARAVHDAGDEISLVVDVDEKRAERLSQEFGARFTLTGRKG